MAHEQTLNLYHNGSEVFTPDYFFHPILIIDTLELLNRKTLL